MNRFAVLVMCLISAGCGDSEPSQPETNSVATASEVTTTKECEVGNPVEQKEIGVIEEFEIRTAPSDEAERLKNEKASEALGKTHYHVIDNSTTVKQLCSQGEWSKVQIVSPEWLTFVKGWVPNKVLRGIARTSDGMRVYVESDIIWDNDTTPFKKEIVASVNKIAREHEGCKDIDPSVVAKSPSRSKPGKPIFFVTCGFSGTPFNVWFEPGFAN